MVAENADAETHSAAGTGQASQARLFAGGYRQPEELTILTLGLGQDSTALLLKILNDSGFRESWAPGRLACVFADTGNEHPHTYRHLEHMKELCGSEGIELHVLEPGDEYHSEAWPDLVSQYRRSDTVGSKAYRKSCSAKILHLGVYLKWARIVCLYKRHGYNDSRPKASLRTARPHAKPLPECLPEGHARALSLCEGHRTARTHLPQVPKRSQPVSQLLPLAHSLPGTRFTPGGPADPAKPTRGRSAAHSEGHRGSDAATEELQKSGSFEGLAGLVHVLNKKRGVQLVVLYLEVDGWRVPWGFRVWRGKDSASPAILALKLLRTLPRVLTARYRVMVLADSGFGSVEFVEGVRQLGHHAVVGVRRDRRLTDGTRLDQASIRGERVFLEGLSVPVYVAAYWLRRDGGKEKRFVLCTRALSPEHIVRWGKRRWRIEGFFKTTKGRFSLERFGQGSRLGVYRYLLLSLIAYVLAHWGYLSQGCEGLPRWGEAARKILEEVLPQTMIEGLLREIEQRSALLRSHGIEVRVDGCKI